MKSGTSYLIRFYLKRSWILLAVLLVLTGGARLAAQYSTGGGNWAQRMFDEAKTNMTRNFGDLALHSEAENRFRFHNIYKEDVVILSAQSSCGCTNVSVPRKVIKAGEIGEIVARVNTTGAFTGKRNVTVTVRFSKPYAAEVQMRVIANIRGDVVFEPGSVEFGSVAEGVTLTKTVYLEYKGQQPDWRLNGIKKNSPSIRATARVENRVGSRKTYRIDVELLPTAKEGYINDLLSFTSNERGSTGVFIPVHGQVISALSVKPTHLQFGVLHPNETTTRNLVVRGSVPFRIVSVQSDDTRLRFKTAPQDSSVHVIPVTLTTSSDETPGEFRKNIRVKTTISELPPLDIAVFGIISDETVAVDENPVQTVLSMPDIQRGLDEYRLAPGGPALGGFDTETLSALFVPANPAVTTPSAVDVEPADELPIPSSISRKFGQRYLASQKIDDDAEQTDSSEESQLASTDAPAVPFTLEKRPIGRTVPRGKSAVQEKDESTEERQIAVASPDSDEEDFLSFELTDNSEAKPVAESDSVPTDEQAFVPAKTEPSLTGESKVERDENGWFPVNNASSPKKADEKKTASPARKKMAAVGAILFRSSANR
ncbi:MAG: DUF1573 domain-containing protein [Thermoguttaceae bacterium]|nr:DUF1573 domain-containing protein [Thermoguttaceae bacterium]